MRLLMSIALNKLVYELKFMKTVVRILCGKGGKWRKSKVNVCLE